MREHIISSYEGYREEDRLTRDNAHRVEFATTVRALDAALPPACRVLDCAAGTGAYAHHLAARGHAVTATDLTPRHIDVLRGSLRGAAYHIDTRVADATDLSFVPDAAFDAVLCMGPLYHLPQAADRARCLAECARVLRPGGLLAIAYISRFFIVQHRALAAPDVLQRSDFLARVLHTGAVHADDPDCFWTDTYFAAPRDAEAMLAAAGLDVCDHLATDGMAATRPDAVNALPPAQFDAWLELHWETCREPSLLGQSNHGLVLGRKPDGGALHFSVINPS